MDNSMQSVLEQSFRSPPRRRRSTFFLPRESLAPQPMEDVDVTETTQHEQNMQQTHNADLTRYYENLLAEKKAWKEELYNRRHKYHDLRQQYQLAASSASSSRLPFSLLTQEDIEFLKGKPNIGEFLEIQQKFHKSVQKATGLLSKVNKLDNRIMTDCESKINKVVEYILENSTVNTEKR